MQRRTFVSATGVLGLAGCAAPLQLPGPRDGVDAEAWHGVALPGKRPTSYGWTEKDGRPALMAQADRSASMWRRKVRASARQPRQLAFSWWVQDLIDGASVADAEREDAPARVLLAFDGDRTRLSARNRMVFDLAEALSGEPPPFATLMVVWDTRAPVGSLVVNPRTDRVRKIVVDSGASELRRWRDHRRDLRADFRRAFGEEPGRLLGVAVMTDADNTQSRALAWYGPIGLA